MGDRRGCASARRGAEDDAEVSWADVPAPRTRRWRAAGARFLASAGLELPPGAPRGEAYRQPPDLDDWLVLLEDYALRCLAARLQPRGGRALRGDRARRCATLGFTLTRKGSVAARRRSTGC